MNDDNDSRPISPAQLTEGGVGWWPLRRKRRTESESRPGWSEFNVPPIIANATVAHVEELSDRIALLEEALRADRDLSSGRSPVDVSERPGPTCIVWSRTGTMIFEHHGEPGLFIEPSVSATRLNAAIEVARLEAQGGNVSVDIVNTYGPPRRDLVVIGEALFRSDSQSMRAVLFDPVTHAAVSGSGHGVEAAPHDSPDLDGRGHREAIGVVVRVVDISAQRRIEEVRRDFVTNISHELRTPVGAIGVLAEMIAGEDSPELVKRLVGRLEIESARLARMIDDLLELAVVEASDPDPDERCDVSEAVTSAFDRIAPGAEAKNMTIEWIDLPHPDHPLVAGSSRQLASALHNLLDNAVKYSDPNSRVQVKVDSSSSPGEVLLSVIDQGVGIPSRDRERIFERFYRVDPARARKTGAAGGTGLGLSIVRHLVDNLGGTVEVSSIEGHGSTFTIRLPALQTGTPSDNT